MWKEEQARWNTRSKIPPAVFIKDFFEDSLQPEKTQQAVAVCVLIYYSTGSKFWWENSRTLNPLCIIHYKSTRINPRHPKVGLRVPLDIMDQPLDTHFFHTWWNSTWLCPGQRPLVESMHTTVPYVIIFCFHWSHFLLCCLKQTKRNSNIWHGC